MRILIIEDELRVEDGSRVWDLVGGLRKTHPATKIFVSRRADCSTTSFDSAADLPYASDGETRLRTGTRKGLEDFLRTIDILILDLGGLNGLQEDWDLTPEKIKSNFGTVHRSVSEISQADIDALKGPLSGIGFYHHHYDALQNVQAVFVVTRWDSTKKLDQEQEQIVERLIDPFCGIDQWTPYTAKYRKDADDLDLLRDRIACLVDLFNDGYTKFDNLFDIEFAAVTDRPVMLIGESGTGKEYTAKAIHRRWVQEKVRAGDLPQTAVGNFAAVNCTLLTEALGSSELFGHLVGAFTGPLDHSLGYVLRACGLNIDPDNPRAHVSKEVDPIGNLVSRTDGLERSNDGNLRIQLTGKVDSGTTDTTPLGTLFLDEFGDLHPSVQGNLLRYLQEFEVAMLGLGGVVKNAKLRIIAATSDPRFAAFAGYNSEEGRLLGQFRTAEELQRPLRSDLLFRIKAHTIRVPPVTGKNAEAVIRHFINSGKFKEAWTDRATKCLVKEVKNQIQAVEDFESGKSRGLYSPVFGHKREIRTTIRMVESFFDTARKRGGRPDEAGITESHVKAIFRPGAVVGTAAGASESSRHDEMEEKEEKKVRDGISEALKQCGRSELANSWTAEDIKSLIPSLSTVNKKILEEAVRGPYRRKFSDWQKAARLRAIGVPAESDDSQLTTKITMVRNWFNKPAPSGTQRTKRS